MRAPTTIRIALIEDEKTTRVELARLLGDLPGFQVVTSYPNAEQALAGIAKDPPDLVLVDLNLPRISGTECIRRLRRGFPDLKIVVLTKYEDADHLFEALRAGANGYLLKKFKETELRSALATAANGGAPMTGEIAVRVLHHFYQQDGRESPLTLLSPRERETLEWLSRGFRYKDIADKLGLASGTVNDYVKSTYKKLQVHSAVEASRFLR